MAKQSKPRAPKRTPDERVRQTFSVDTDLTNDKIIENLMRLTGLNATALMNFAVKELWRRKDLPSDDALSGFVKVGLTSIDFEYRNRNYDELLLRAKKVCIFTKDFHHLLGRSRHEEMLRRRLADPDKSTHLLFDGTIISSNPGQRVISKRYEQEYFDDFKFNILRSSGDATLGLTHSRTPDLPSFFMMVDDIILATPNVIEPMHFVLVWKARDMMDEYSGYRALCRTFEAAVLFSNSVAISENSPHRSLNPSTPT